MNHVADRGVYVRVWFDFWANIKHFRSDVNTNRRDIVPYGSWEQFYLRWPIEEQPWYMEGLDCDLRSWFAGPAKRALKILDVGTGVGTQAIALAQMGHEVVGTDLSETAINAAKERAETAGVACDFIVDDILSTVLTERFDLVFDRGLFHCLHPDERPVYCQAVRRLLTDEGSLIIRCISDDEPDGWGPYRISEDVVRHEFGHVFTAIEITRISIDAPFFHLDNPHLAGLFVVMSNC